MFDPTPNDPKLYELYGYWRTSATYRVRVALKLKGLDYREHFVDIDKGEQRSPEFLRINPLGGLPAFIEPGHPPLTQSLAILEFIEEAHPAHPLMPTDPHGRARVRSLCGMLAADTHPFVTPRVRKYLSAQPGFDDAAWRAWQINWFTTGLQAVESRLAHDDQTGAYCHGNAITLADIVLCSIPAVTQVFKITVPDIPTINRIVALCNTTDAFAEADPYKQHGAPKHT